MRARYFRLYNLIVIFLFLILCSSCTLESTESRNRQATKIKFKDDSLAVADTVHYSDSIAVTDTILETEDQASIPTEFKFDELIDFVYNKYTETATVKNDLDEIRKRGKLVALTGYSYTSYFIYKGTTMGYEYELLQELAKHLKVDLEIVIVQDMDQIFDMLNRGEGDIIADNLTITKTREELVDFTVPHNTTRQVLVQKKPYKWRQMKLHEIEKALIRDPLELAGKEVHVRRESSYYSRLENLSNEIGADIKIVEAPGDMETEELIMKVSEGKIPYTIADENIAQLNMAYYSNLDIKTAVSFSQNIAWAVRKSSPKLHAAVNAWIRAMKKEPSYYTVYNKYYKAHQGVDYMVNCSKTLSCGRNISRYDKAIMQHAKELGWDWRLLAALIYQESQFKPEAKSWTGASGLMQLMPATAELFGATNPKDPFQSLEAGTKYIKWLDNYWKVRVPDKQERIKFIMASYNVGQEHVADAYRLAQKYNKNPQVWDGNVAYFLLQKSKPRYCSDPVVKYGYCRGMEPYNYVNNILDRYQHYKKLIHVEG